MRQNNRVYVSSEVESYMRDTCTSCRFKFNIENINYFLNTIEDKIKIKRLFLHFIGILITVMMLSIFYITLVNYNYGGYIPAKILLFISIPEVILAVILIRILNSLTDLVRVYNLTELIYKRIKLYDDDEWTIEIFMNYIEKIARIMGVRKDRLIKSLESRYKIEKELSSII